MNSDLSDFPSISSIQSLVHPTALSKAQSADHYQVFLPKHIRSPLPSPYHKNGFGSFCVSFALLLASPRKLSTGLFSSKSIKLFLERSFINILLFYFQLNFSSASFRGFIFPKAEEKSILINNLLNLQNFHNA